MLKALIKSLENKHLDPGLSGAALGEDGHPGTLGPSLPTNWEKNPEEKL